MFESYTSKTLYLRFTRATATANDAPVWVNTDHILTVAARPHGSEITLSNGGPLHTIDVNQTPDEVMNRLGEEARK